MVVARRRRRRRPLWVIVAAFLSVVVLAVNAAASSGPAEVEERRATVAYLDSIRPEIERSTKLGADVADLQARAAEIGRATIARRIVQISKDASRTLAAVTEVEVPEHLATTHSLLVATFSVRARATAKLRSALADALDAAKPPPPSGRLVAISQDLLAADRTYAAFRTSFPASPETALPTSKWMTGQPLTPEEAQAFLASLRSAMSLAPVHDVSVVVVALDPTPVGTEGDAAVLPMVRTLKVNVVVANTGNGQERRVPVLAQVTGADGAVDTKRNFVTLAPGQRATVTVGGLRMPRGGATSLSVTAGPVEGEGNVADNQRSKALVLR